MTTECVYDRLQAVCDSALSFIWRQFAADRR